MKIKNIEIGDLVLAPMAGVTDFAFRAIAKQFGAGLTYTEMVSAKGLVYGGDKEIYKQMLHTLDCEKPCAVQLFGSEPKIFAEAIKHPLIQKFDIIDINMGCPAPKIVKNGDGSCLLKNVDLAVEIAKTVVENTDKPVTVKFRLGYEDGDDVSVELAKKLEEVGVSAITVHGRTRSQFYSGKVNLEAIRKVKNAVKIPVIGNGDVFDKKSYEAMKQTGVDAVMVGRGAMGRPWIFKMLREENWRISPEEKVKFIKFHIENLAKIYSEKFVVNHMRKHLLWYCKEVIHSNDMKMKFCKIQTIKESLNLLDLFIKKV